MAHWKLSLCDLMKDSQVEREGLRVTCEGQDGSEVLYVIQ